MKLITAILLSFLLGALSGGYVLKTYYMIGAYESFFAIKTKKPLLIAGEGDGNLSILPKGTVLYHEQSYAEGHSRYKAYFYFKGQIESEKFDASKTSPLWLYTAEKDDIKDFCKTEH